MNEFLQACDVSFARFTKSKELNTVLTYDDFTIEISLSDTGSSYVLRAFADAHWEQENAAFSVSDQDMLRMLQETRGSPFSALDESIDHAQELGDVLFRFLFSGSIGAYFTRSLLQSKQNEKGLRISLIINEPELTILPWELLWDGRNGDFLSLNRSTPILRANNTPYSKTTLVVTPPLQILGVTAAPIDLQPLDIDQEKRRLEDALNNLRRKNLVQLAWLEEQSQRALERAISTGSWNIIHFVGHGGFDHERNSGYIALCNEDGRSVRLYAEDMAQLVEHPSLRLVFLNACGDIPHFRDGLVASDHLTSNVAALNRHRIPAVVGMQYPISDKNAIEFARTFYEAVADNLTVEAAITDARRVVKRASPHSLEWATPILYVSARDGRLFLLDDSVHGEFFQQDVSPFAKLPRYIGPSLWIILVLAITGILVWRNVEITPVSTEMTPTSFTIQEHIVDGVTFVFIPAGEFSMGLQEGNPDEQPVHQVNLDSYWIMRTEVTNAQYSRFIRAGGYDSEHFWTEDGWKWRNENNIVLPKQWADGGLNKEESAVVGISWYEAIAYANWFSETIGFPARLPSEAEWEKVARGASGGVYPWGNIWDSARANSYGVEDGYSSVAPVGSFPRGASTYGALDMAGNVWEWVYDWYDKDYYARSSYDNPHGPDWGEYRGVRGGSWVDNVSFLRTTLRYKLRPGSRYDSVGFRLVALLPPDVRTVNRQAPFVLYDGDPGNRTSSLCSGFRSDCSFGKECVLGQRIIYGPYCRSGDYPNIYEGLYRVDIQGIGKVDAGATDYGATQQHFAFGRYQLSLPDRFTFCWPGREPDGYGFEIIVANMGEVAEVDRITITYLSPSC